MVQCGPAFIVIYLLMPALVLLHTALTSFSNLLRDSPSTSFNLLHTSHLATGLFVPRATCNVDAFL